MDSASAPITAGALLAEFRTGRTFTKAEIIESTGLSRSTANLRLDELIARGLVASEGEADSSGGRPPKLYRWQPRARLVAAADFGASHGAVAVMDLAGTILGRVTTQRPIASGPDASIRWLGSTIRQILTDLDRAADDLLAVGIGLPGPVAWPTGRPTSPPIMPGWDGVDVPRLVADELGVPAVVDNDVNVMALGEQTHAWPDVSDMLFVKIATGIGSGIISGGRLQRGADGVAGDIGHVRVARGEGVTCSCGDTGCLEALASAAAIMTALRATGLEIADNSALVALTVAGDERAVAAVRQAGRDIGEVLAAGIRFLDPEVIVLGGSVARCGEPLLEGIRSILSARSMPHAARSLRVALSVAGPDAALFGAGRLALDLALDPARIDAMVAANS